MRASGLTRAKTGLGSRINTFAYEVWHAMMYNMSFSICSNGRQIGWWSQYFQDSHMYSVCNSSSKPGVCDPFMKTVGGAVNELRKRNLSADYVDDMWRFIYRKVFTLKMSERDARRRVLESAGLVLDKPFIALHMRRGDKYKEAVIVQSSVYANATKQFLGPSQRNSRFGALLSVLRYEMAAKQASQVFVSSDDEEAAQEMQRSLGQSAKVICQPRLGNENYYAKRDYDNSTIFLNLLTDLYALSVADAFIGTGSSNIGRLVYFLRQKNATSISLSGSFLYQWR